MTFCRANILTHQLSVLSRYYLVYFFSLVVLILPAEACDFDDSDGLDVALVLSGGGAKTTTQVGALKIIEELGVPIHCIVGTSMGGVTGALYASGYSAQDLVTIYGGRDWNEIFRGGVPRADRPYLQKRVDDQYFAGYAAGIGADGINLPGGFGDMSGLQAEFRQLFSHLPSNIDFDRDLRVPYRAVAMNLSTGEAKAFASGDIVQAILASMSVPGVFAPRQIDGQLYVDGGLAKQLPISEARALGADIIIAIDTSDPPINLEGSQSVATTTQQLLRITIWSNRQSEVALLSERDLLITPDLTGVTTGTFHEYERGFASGILAATQVREELLAIKAVAAPSRDRVLNTDNTVTPVGSLRVINESNVADQVIGNRFNYAPEDQIDSKEVQARLRNLASFGNFGNVDLSNANDAPELRVSSNNLGRNLLQAGFQASTTFDGDARYGLLARLSRRPINQFGGEASLSLEIGTDIGVTLQAYQPFGESGNFFVIPAVSFRSDEILFDVGPIRIADFTQRVGTGQVRLGRELGRWGVISIEGIAGIGRLSPQLSVDPDNISASNFKRGGVGISFAYDTLDRVNWPGAGIQIRANGQQLFDFDGGGATGKYSLFATTAKSFGSNGLQLRFAAERIDENDDTFSEILYLGGFRRLSFAPENTVPNNQYIFGSIEAFHRLTNTDGILNFPVYVGLTAEYANVEFDFIEAGETAEIWGGSAYLGADTIIGPAFFGIGIGSEADVSVFLHIGRSF